MPEERLGDIGFAVSNQPQQLASGREQLGRFTSIKKFNGDAVFLKFFPEEFFGGAGRWRSDRDESNVVVSALKVDRQLGAASFGSACVDFGDEQIDFHSWGLGLCPRGRSS